jgi:hypothetical protein
MKFAAAFLALLPAGVVGAPATTCAEQSSCIKVDVKQTTSGVCGGCEYEVCMTFTLDEPCVTKGSSISHTCDWPDNLCAVPSGAQDPPGSDAPEPGVDNGDVFCITVPAGTDAEFVFKDGNDDCGTYDGPITGLLGDAKCEDPGRGYGCSESPNNCIWSIPTPKTCDGGIKGDPHVSLWNEKRISYHGEGDFLLVRKENYAEDKDIEVQVRTSIQDFYSYISSAAVRVGDDVLEASMGEHGHLWLNGEELTDDELPTTISGYTLNVPEEAGNAKLYRIDLEGADNVEIKIYKYFLSVSVGGANRFVDSVGMIGSYGQGKMLGRDGITEFANVNKYGAEWQVRDTEKMLFREARAPQFPAKPIMPSEEAQARRRTRENDEALVAQAEKACAHKSEKDFEICVYDVVATGDLGMAGAW